MRLKMVNPSGLRALLTVTVLIWECGTAPGVASAQSVPTVNAAEAQSLAQNNAYNLNVGIQDFPIQLNIILTNLTEGVREKIARETKDTVFRAFLQQQIVDPFERVRDDLKTASEDITRASLNFAAQKVVNDVITQFNNVWKLIYGRVQFRGKWYTRSHFLSAAAIYELDSLIKQLKKVIQIHKDAVAQVR